MIRSRRFLVPRNDEEIRIFFIFFRTRSIDDRNCTSDENFLADFSKSFFVSSVVFEPGPSAETRSTAPTANENSFFDSRTIRFLSFLWPLFIVLFSFFFPSSFEDLKDYILWSLFNLLLFTDERTSNYFNIFQLLFFNSIHLHYYIIKASVFQSIRTIEIRRIYDGGCL